MGLTTVGGGGHSGPHNPRGTGGVSNRRGGTADPTALEVRVGLAIVGGIAGIAAHCAKYRARIHITRIHILSLP